MLPAIPLIPEQYAAVTSTPEKSPMRMLSPDGNPQARNLCAVIDQLQKETGVRLAVTVAR